jgi:seryl-tRNA(Sec) selenium transferase
VDLVIFSGGKDLRGPQSSGLILGRKDLIEACRLHGSPNANIGRPMKVGKEEMLGLLAAVERYLHLDHEERSQYCEDAVKLWSDALNRVPGLNASRSYPNEAGQPLPRCQLTIDDARLGLSRDALVEQLESGNPSIVVAPFEENSIQINPMTLEAGEESIILKRLLDIVERNESTGK